MGYSGARREVWLQRGRLDIAIRASIALPGIFTPVMLNGRLLADGGLMDPIPVSPTAALDVDLTIGVSAGGERHGPPATAAVSEPADPRPFDDRVARFRRGAARALDKDLIRSVLSPNPEVENPEAEAGRQEEEAESEASEFPIGLTGFDVMNHSIGAMQTLVNRYRLAGSPPDVLVTIPASDVRMLDFHRAGSMIGEWLTRFGASWVLLRPDRFVFAHGGSGGGEIRRALVMGRIAGLPEPPEPQSDEALAEAGRVLVEITVERVAAAMQTRAEAQKSATLAGAGRRRPGRPR